MATPTNQYFRATPLTGNLEPFQLPAKELAFALERQQERYDEGLGYAEDLAALNVAVLPEQVARKNAILQDFNKKVENTISLYDGNYARANPALRKLKLEASKLIAPGGELHTMEQNLATYTKALEEEKKRVGKKDGIIASQLENWASHVRGQFAKRPDIDPETGAFKTIDMPPIAAYQDLNQMAFDIGKDLPAQVLEGSGFKKGPAGWYTETEYGYEILDKEYIKSIAGNMLRSNPAAINYLTQSMTHAGIEPTEENINAYIDQAAETAGTAFQKFNVSEKSKLKLDNYSLERYKNQLDLSTNDMMDPQLLYSKSYKTGEIDKFKVDPISGSLYKGSWIGALWNQPNVNMKDMLANPGEFKAAEVNLAKQVKEELQQRGINLDNLSDRETNKYYRDISNDIATSLATVNGLEMKFGEDVQLARTNSTLRSGFVLDRHVAIVDEDQNTSEILTLQEAADRLNVNVEEITGEAFVTGYSTPMLGRPNGDIIQHPSFEGSKLILVNTDIKVDKVYEPMTNASIIYRPDVDEVDDVFLAHVIQDQRLNSYDESGRPKPFKLIKNSKGQVEVINADGVNLTKEYGIGFDTAIETATNIILRGGHLTTVEGVGNKIYNTRN